MAPERMDRAFQQQTRLATEGEAARALVAAVMQNDLMFKVKTDSVAYSAVLPNSIYRVIVERTDREADDGT